MLTLWKYLIILDKIEVKNNNEKPGSKPGKKNIFTIDRALKFKWEFFVKTLMRVSNIKYVQTQLELYYELEKGTNDLFLILIFTFNR